MSARQLAEEIETLVAEAMEASGIAIDEFQKRLYNGLLRIIKDLELDSDGYIKQTAINRRVLYDAENFIYESLPGKDLTEIVTTALKVIPGMDALNAEYFTGISKSFSPNRAFVKSLQNQTIRSIESNLLQDGLTASIRNPLVNILYQNVNSGGQFSGFLQQVRSFIAGDNEIEGRVYSYSRTFLSDALFDYSRAYQQSMTADLGLEWYSYNGGVMDKTRPFCEERVDKFYHQKEVEGWVNEEWQGKRAGTTKSSIFVYCGGYNCRHSLIPVSERIVPKEDLDRIKNP
jgi:hypothetical protein